ncbi:ROK family transcriptional regulator [Ruania zhangjianzhongii]|uniref:ROK family transcriptional regulator n=1 Tax=Ruania zhangjianzhongii TaxID=2603206 RepID=UPI001F361DD8|nr:ROK family protein [Ruania zhangjianzhongii]
MAVSPTSRTTGPGELLQILRDGAPRARADLVAVTGHARTTIGSRIDALLRTGLVRTEAASSTGGRPPSVYVFDPGARVVLAVDLGAVHLSVAVLDLAGTVLAEERTVCDIAEGPDPVLAHVNELGQQLLDRLGRPATDLAGVGIGVPGPVQQTTGRPITPPIMPHWDGVDIKGILGRQFGVPVLVDNDVDLMALGEHGAVYPEVSHLLFVKVATGIGAGIIANRTLVRGTDGAAGDLGHVAVPGGRAELCHCGNSGCLEAVASGGALVRALRAAGEEVATSADVVDLVRRGDQRATALLRDAGRDLGAVLAGCVNLLNPSAIVIGGVLAQAGEHLLAGAREVVYRRSLPLATKQLRIVTASTAGRAGLLGAGRVVADHVLAPAAVDALAAAQTPV